MEYGENILYRAGIMGGRVQDPGDGHKILCPDTPRHLQAVDIALNRIDPLPAKVVRVWYCAPQKEDGEAHTKAELVLLMRENGYRDMSLAAFDKKICYNKLGGGLFFEKALFCERRKIFLQKQKELVANVTI
jgi:hypothetical protein